jgi:hypothetical protein
VKCGEFQQSLFPPVSEKARKSEKLLDDLRARYGEKISRASLLDSPDKE